MIHDHHTPRRRYERQFIGAVEKERVAVAFWARRCRKSTTLGAIAFSELSKAPGRTVIAASASLLLGSELIHMTTSATEEAVIVREEADAQFHEFQTGAAQEGLDFRCADAESGKEYTGLTRDDFADLYKSRRLEMRLHFNGGGYSRQLVIAPMPATARGWRGTVLRDEAGFTPVNLEMELREAIDPIFRDVPDLKMIYASNLGRDDRHPFFTMTLPEVGTPPPAPEPNEIGHFYRGENHILIHKVSLADAYAAGHVLYDNKGKPMTLEAFRADPANKAQLPYNYDLEHLAGGAAAIDLLALITAQRRGVGECSFVYVNCDEDFQRAIHSLRANLRGGRIGLGFDPATTTRETSNPSSLTITEDLGSERCQRLVVLWKERKAQVVIDRLTSIVRIIRERATGGPARRFCIAATNERYFADLLSDALRPFVPVELIIESSTLQPAGYDDAINFKTYLGDLYSTAVNENRYALPNSEYFKKGPTPHDQEWRPLRVPPRLRRRRARRHLRQRRPRRARPLRRPRRRHHRRVPRHDPHERRERCNAPLRVRSSPPPPPAALHAEEAGMRKHARPIWEHPTPNIQHRTSNPPSARPHPLDVGCWTARPTSDLDVGCSIPSVGDFEPKTADALAKTQRRKGAERRDSRCGRERPLDVGCWMLDVGCSPAAVSDGKTEVRVARVSDPLVVAFCDDELLFPSERLRTFPGNESSFRQIRAEREACRRQPARVAAAAASNVETMRVGDPRYPDRRRANAIRDAHQSFATHR